MKNGISVGKDGSLVIIHHVFSAFFQYLTRFNPHYSLVAPQVEEVYRDDGFSSGGTDGECFAVLFL